MIAIECNMTVEAIGGIYFYMGGSVVLTTVWTWGGGKV